MNPDAYLKPGDHIQRDLDAVIPFASHEGIYLGNGKVAHICTVDANANGFTVLSEKMKACARIHNLKEFIIHPRREIRVIVSASACLYIYEMLSGPLYSTTLPRRHM